MFMPFIAALAIIRAVYQNSFMVWAQLFFSFILGLLISGYFWLPALLDSNLVKYDTVFNFIDHFPTLRQLFTPYWGYGASVAGPGDGMSFFLGISSMVVLILGILLTGVFWNKYSSQQKIILAWTIISLIIVFFVMNFRSTLIWQKAPLLPFFQFPWRFLMMTTFLIPILVVTFEKIKYRWWVTGLLIIITLTVNSFYFRPQDFLGRTDEYFLNKYIPVPGASEEYKMQQEEYLRLPKDTSLRPKETSKTLVDEMGEEVGGVNDSNPLNVSGKSTFSREEIVGFNKYYFPGWKVSIDDEEVKDIKAGQPHGQLTFLAPAGTHEIHIYFTETKFKLFLDLISMLCLSLSIFLILKSRYEN
jgi:hypothetical protein